MYGTNNEEIWRRMWWYWRKSIRPVWAESRRVKTMKVKAKSRVAEFRLECWRVNPFFIALGVIYRQGPMLGSFNVANLLLDLHCRTRGVDVHDGTRMFVMGRILSFFLIHDTEWLNPCLVWWLKRSHF